MYLQHLTIADFSSKLKLRGIEKYNNSGNDNNKIILYPQKERKSCFFIHTVKNGFELHQAQMMNYTIRLFMIKFL